VRHLAAAQLELLLGEHDDRSAFGGLVGQARELRGVGQLRDRDVAERLELDRLAIAQGDGAGLVEEQRVDVPGRLDGPPAHRQHVVLHHTIHAGDADRRQQAADRGRNQADEQRHQDRDARHGACAEGADRVGGERQQGRDRQQEHERQAGDQDVERDLPGVLLAPSTRAIMIDEGLAGASRT
jgi:hypothetical protein